MNKTNKKVSTLAATVAVATAFCGLCAGIATTVKAESAPAPVKASATSDYKVILNPGWNFENGVKKLNTIKTGVTEADAAKYFAENAYVCNLATGADLPKPEAGRDGLTFVGWRYSKNGELITVNKVPAAKDANVYLYADWTAGSTSGGGNGGGQDEPTPGTKVNGVYIGDTLVGKLEKNEKASGAGLVAEYWFGGAKFKLNKGAKVSVYMNGKPVSFFVDGSSAGIDKPGDGKKVDSVTVTTEGEFAIYLRDYSSKEKPDNWTCEFAGPTEINVGSEIPAGCSKISVTWGTHSMNFYLVDSNGKGIGSSDFSKYCIYTFNAELFGDWATSATKGVVKASMSSTVTGTVEGWIFRWGSGYGTQTANITGLVDGGTYIIKLPATHKGDPTVTKLNV